MSKKINIADFNIDMGKVPQADIRDKCNLFSKKHLTFLRNKYGSEYEFLVLLYHLHFVEQLQREEIAQKLDCRIPNIHHQLYELGWDHSPDYSENKILYQEALAKLRNDVEIARKTSRLLDMSQNDGLKEVLEKAKDVRESWLVDLGFASKEEYARTLYYMRFRMGYDRPRRFIHLFRRSISSVSHNLRILGLNNSYEEGMRIKEQDYEKSIRNGKITTTKHQFRSFSHGAKNQDYFRSQLSKVIYRYFPSQKYEAIIGFSDSGILGRGLEIDIPVVIYDVNKKAFHRFAIEYGAKHWHSGERDTNKKTLCESKGWHFIEVFEDSVGSVSNKPELLDPVIRDVCLKIEKIILTTDI